MGQLDQLADVVWSYPALSGLNDHAPTGSGPTRQSDTRDSEPLNVSVAGARAGSLLFDTRSFFLCDAELSEVSRQKVQTEERILSCNDTSQEGCYGFESSSKEDELVPSLVRP